MVYVGKLSLDKGVHCLIAALPEIAAWVPDVHLLVIGEGVAWSPLEKMVAALDRGDLEAAAQALAEAPTAPQEQSWLAPVTLFWEHVDEAAYRAAARAACLGGRVTFAGHLPHADVARVLPAAEVLVIPSLVKEAFPLVSLEALACGVPPVGPYHGGLMPILDEIATALDPWGNLIRVDPRPEAFVADLAARVSRLLHHLSAPDIRDQTARRCRTIAVRNYDWDRVVKELEQVYREVLTLTHLERSHVERIRTNVQHVSV
ncbi:MAG: glycosyltransferase family 4 protein [Anaerolineae bacterium]